MATFPSTPTVFLGRRHGTGIQRKSVVPNYRPRHILQRFKQRCICSPKIVEPRPKRVGRAGFSLSRALFRKKCGAPHLGRQTPFFRKKTGYLFSNHRLSVVQCHPYLFSPEKPATFFAHHCHFYSFYSFTLVSPIISGMQKNLPLLLWGPLFVGAPVRPNMLNMPKSAAAA